jgi:hypothetical protein
MLLPSVDITMEVLASHCAVTTPSCHVAGSYNWRDVLLIATKTRFMLLNCT